MSWLPTRKPAWAKSQENGWKFEVEEANPISRRSKRGVPTDANALKGLAGKC